jgi:protein gp37
MATPARARFLSMEPLLGPADLRAYLVHHHPDNDPSHPAVQALVRAAAHMFGAGTIDWVIVGGESGRGARPMHPIWAKTIRDQCSRAGVPFFFKQWGEWAPHRPVPGGDLGADTRAGRVIIVHPTGQSPDEVFVESGRNTIPGSLYMARVGKKAAGRLLNGREWNEFPHEAVSSSSSSN